VKRRKTKGRKARSYCI